MEVEDPNGADLPQLVQPSQLSYMHPNSLVVAGSMHILHSVTRSLTDQLRHFKEWLHPGFKALIDMLRRRYYRKFYCRRCLSDEQYALYAASLSSFVATLVDHRWGYVVDAAKALEPLEVILRLTWDSRKLNHGAGEDQDEDMAQHAIRTDDFKLASNFVHDASCWAYLKMILMVARIIDLFSAFLRSCPCHSSRLNGVMGESWHMRYRAFSENLNTALRKPCPIMRRRAPRSGLWRATQVVDGLDHCRGSPGASALCPIVFATSRSHHR
jgi:hypothetical protein